MFGNADPNAGITLCVSDKAGCNCQAKALKSATKTYAARLKLYNKCTKLLLKHQPAIGPADLAFCLNADGKAKIAKTVTKLGGSITKKCVTVTPPFAAGQCSGLNGDALRDCLNVRTRCGACLTVQASDSLFGDLDCEFYDDGLANASCQNDF